MADETTATAEEQTTEETPEAQTTEETTEKQEPDWKAQARKHEDRAKKAQKRIEALEKEAKDRENADKSEQEKAVEAAREEGRTAAQTEAEKERRKDRLEAAVHRHAAKGITIGEGDEAKDYRFADPEDALLNLQRGDTDDLFDDEGKVNTDALTDALREQLERKPYLRAGDPSKPSGDADTRKGESADTDLESMTPEDHAKAKYAQK